MVDVDKYMGFWIKDIPYIWNSKNNKRYYLFSDPSIATVYNSENKKCIYVYNDINEYSLFYFDVNNYHIRKYFLVQQHLPSLMSELETRLEGEKCINYKNYISKWDDNFLTIVDSKTGYIKEHPLKKRDIVYPFINLYTVPKFDETPKHLVSRAEKQGLRKTMEDQMSIAKLGDDIWWYAVMDGHAGGNTSKHFSKVLPKYILESLRKLAKKEKVTHSFKDIKDAIVSAFLLADHSWFGKDPQDSGTTVSGVLITHEKVYLVNLGDSRCIISINGDVITETVDHKPKNERKRIEKAGGFVRQNRPNGAHRINGTLAVSRSLGDFVYKKKDNEYMGKYSIVSPIPDIIEYNRIDNNINSKDHIIVIACDGLYDVMESKDVIDMITESKKVDKSIANDIVQEAIDMGTSDNVSVMVLKIK